MWVSGAGVDTANTVIAYRTAFKEMREPGEETMPSTSQRLASRNARASTPGEGKAAEERPRKTRRRWQKLMRQLGQEKLSAGKWWEDAALVEAFNMRHDDIVAMADEADEAALEHGYPFIESHVNWQNVYEDSSRSHCEEALRLILKDIDMLSEEVERLFAKQESPPVLRRAAGPGGRGCKGGYKGGYKDGC